MPRKDKAYGYWRKQATPPEPSGSASPAPSTEPTATESVTVTVYTGVGPSTNGFALNSPLFFDDFDYTVTNDYADATANQAAFAAAGWDGSKGVNLTNAGAGNLYTVDVSSIPGHTGTAPGSTQKALCINSLAGTLGVQTDFYLQHGSASDSIGKIPADVWFQFWVYVCRSGAQQSQFHSREKFIYATRQTAYPSTLPDGNTWMFQPTTSGYYAYPATAGIGEAYPSSRDQTTTGTAPDYDHPDATGNGQRDVMSKGSSTTPMWEPNTWCETRIHFDTSTASGVFQVWTRRVGQDWELIADWQDGVSVAGYTFDWVIDAAFRDGHRQFRMPTTLPGSGAATPTHDLWLYMQDFAMAGSVNDLPTYEGY